jgi:hypothetical protein
MMRPWQAPRALSTSQIIARRAEASDGAVERGQVSSHRPLDELGIAVQIAHHGEVGPWNRGALLANLFAEVPVCLADSKQVARKGAGDELRRLGLFERLSNRQPWLPPRSH